MGVVQGLTEFLPVSSSGHLIIVPALLGWHDPFITSLAFSVMLHVGTLVALLIYFRADWARLVPAGLATIRDRSFDGDGDRRLAWLLVVGAAILWLAERTGSRRLLAVDLTFPRALGIGLAQSLALIPGISRSGISIAAGLFTGLDRESAARFSFLM